MEVLPGEEEAEDIVDVSKVSTERGCECALVRGTGRAYGVEDLRGGCEELSLEVCRATRGRLLRSVDSASWLLGDCGDSVMTIRGAAGLESEVVDDLEERSGAVD